MALDPTPQRQRVLSFVSPNVGDILFYERVDAQRVGEKNVPEYGTPHPDSRAWPHHKLVLITSSDAAGGQDQQGRFFRYYYAAERDNQDEYNFEYGNTQLGGRLVDTVTRTYVILRSNFDPAAANLAIGSTMPDIPVGQFEGTWKLYDVTQKRIGEQELDSLFVVLELVYVLPDSSEGISYGEIVTINDTVTAVVPEGTPVDTGINIISSRVEPLGNGQAVKTTRSVEEWPSPVDISVGTPPAGIPSLIYFDSLKTTTFTEKVATIPTTISLSGNTIGVTYKRETPDRVEEETTQLDYQLNSGLLETSINRSAYLVTTRETTVSNTEELPPIGDVSSELVYRSGELDIHRNTTVTTQGVAGLKGTDTLSQSWGAITETTEFTLTPVFVQGGNTRLIFKDSMTSVYESSTVSVNATGTSQEVDAQVWGTLTWSGEFDTTSSGVRSRQVWTNGVTSVFLNENPTLSINDTPFISAVETNALLTEEVTTSYSDTTPAEPAANSTSRVIYQLDGTRVYENSITVIQPSASPRSYASVIQYDLPSILLGIEIISFPLRNGGSETHFKPNVEEGLSGTFPCVVTEYYTEEPVVPSMGDLQMFRPKPVAFTTPWGGLNLGATLHDDLSFTYSTGTQDPRYKYAVGTVNIPATTPTTYKGLTFLAAFNATPYKNGFVIREYRITIPA
jgi:hypothetical protein